MRIKPWKPLIGVAAALVVAGASVLTVAGSSHNDAPLIVEDPTANNTDVYAFVSPDRPDYVTLISNYIPMEAPGNGPTHYRFSDNVLYEIMVDVDGDAKEDVTYQLEFENNIVNGDTFLYNTGQIGVPDAAATAQYPNLNVQQSYDLTEVVGDRRTGASTVQLSDARVAPAHVGASSTGTKAQYEVLADAAIHTFGGNDSKVFVGPRDEGFYIDLMGFFDLLNLRGKNQSVDTFSGFNVHSIALEIPKTRFQAAGDTDGIIGVWASASRPKITTLPGNGDPANTSGKWVQVSRLGNTLVNELLMPLDAKDLFNATEPKDDADNIADFIINPGDTQSPAAIVPLLNSVTGCTPVNGRGDLELVLLKGIPAGVLGLPGNQDTQQPDGPVTADMLRLNFNVAPAAEANSLGVFGGDVAGFPNGRRVGDVVTDIFARAGAGAVLQLLGAIDCEGSLGVTDNVQENDVEYLDSFPYLGTPHQAYSHEHAHSTGSMKVMGAGFGLLAGGLALGSVFVIKRRRDPMED